MTAKIILTHSPVNFTSLDDEGVEDTLTFELFNGQRKVPFSVLTSVPDTFFTALVHMKCQQNEEGKATPVLLLDKDPVIFDQAICFLQSVHQNQPFHSSGPEPTLACNFEYYLLRDAYVKKCEKDCRPKTDLILMSIQETNNILQTDIKGIHHHVHDIHENLLTMTRGFGELHMSHTRLPCSNRELDGLDRALKDHRLLHKNQVGDKWTLDADGRKPYVK